MRTSSREPVFSPYPLAVLLVALAVGVLLAHFYSISLSLSLSLTALLSVFAIFLLARQKYVWSTIAVVSALFFAGSALETIASQNPASQIKRLISEGCIGSDEPVEITGVLDRPLEYTPDGFYLTLRVEKLRSANLDQGGSGVVQLFAPARDEHASSMFDSLRRYYGARIRALTALERADNYRNPGVSPLSEFLDRKGYDATGKLKSPLLVERLDDARVFTPLRWLYEWRRRLELEIKQHFSAETAGVLDAAFLGNRYFLSRAAAEKFREGGTFHVLVISGLHISFIGGMVFLLARRVTKSRWFQFIASAAVLWGYTLAVGAESSVVRSALMFTLIVLAPVVARKASSLNTLGGAGLMLLVWRPDELFDASFQLTFLSVLAIIVIAVPLLRKLALIGEWHPTRETPYPPACAAWLRSYCEMLYWSERRWRDEMVNANYSYKLSKAPLAVILERYRLQPLLRYAASALVVSGSVQVGLRRFSFFIFIDCRVLTVLEYRCKC